MSDAEEDDAITTLGEFKLLDLESSFLISYSWDAHCTETVIRILYVFIVLVIVLMLILIKSWHRCCLFEG